MLVPPQVKPKSEPRRTSIGQRIVIGATNGRLERDADRRADRALARSNEVAVREMTHPIRSDAAGRTSLPVTSNVGHVISSSGAPLERCVRLDMERRFGESFSHVRIHTGAAAARSAADVSARAYTFGSHIVLGERESPSDRRLLAHELAHVVQQGTQPILLRKPVTVKLDPTVDRSAPDPKIPQWKPADQVAELRRLPADNWEIVMSGRTSVESARAALWPKWFPADIAPMTLKIAITDPIEKGWFVISDLDFWHLQYMEPSIAGLFRDRGLVDESKDSPELAKARDAFRKNNSKLAGWMTGMIDRALKRATRGNAELMLAYYRYYSSHDLKSETMSGLGETSSGDTEISFDLLLQQPKQATSDKLALLGSTLVHEFVHTPQGPRELGGQVTQIRKEAKAYAVELLFAERMGDTKRAADIEKQWYSNDSVIISMGADKVFNRTYNIISKLYEIIDSKGGDEAAAARRMSIEFISKNEADYGPELKDFIAKIGR